MRVLLPALVLLMLAGCGDRPPASPRLSDTAAGIPLDPGACRSDERAVALYDDLMHPRRLEPDEIALVLDRIEFLDDPCYVDSLTAFLERFDEPRFHYDRGFVLADLVRARSHQVAAWLVASQEQLVDSDWRQVAITTRAEAWRDEALASTLLAKASDPALGADDRSYVVEAFGEIGTLAEVLTLAERYEQGDVGDPSELGPSKLRRSYLTAFTRFDHPRLNVHVREALAEPDLAVFTQRFLLAHGIARHRRHDLLPTVRAFAERLAASEDAEDRMWRKTREATLEAIAALEANSAAGVRPGLPLTWPNPLSWPDTTAMP